MRICRMAVLALLGFLMASQGFAQEDAEGIVSPAGFIRYFTIGGGAVYQEFFDESISSIRYQGFGAAPQFGNIKMNEKMYSELILQPSYAVLKRPSDKTFKTDVKSYRGSLDYKHLYKIQLRNERLDFRPGGLVSMNFNYKDAPQMASTGYVREYAISLGVAARIAKEIELDEQRLAHLSWAVGIPLVAHYARPTYLNRIERLDPDDKPGTDFFANSRTSFIGKYMRFNSKIAYDYALHNGNILMIGYTWDYYKMKTDSHTVWFAENTVSLTLMFNY